MLAMAAKSIPSCDRPSSAPWPHSLGGGGGGVYSFSSSFSSFFIPPPPLQRLSSGIQRPHIKKHNCRSVPLSSSRKTKVPGSGVTRLQYLLAPTHTHTARPDPRVVSKYPRLGIPPRDSIIDSSSSLLPFFHAYSRSNTLSCASYTSLTRHTRGVGCHEVYPEEHPTWLHSR